MAGIIGAIVGVLFAPVLLPAAVGALGFGSGGVVAGKRNPSSTYSSKMTTKIYM